MLNNLSDLIDSNITPSFPGVRAAGYKKTRDISGNYSVSTNRYWTGKRKSYSQYVIDGIVHELTKKY